MNKYDKAYKIGYLTALNDAREYAITQKEKKTITKTILDNKIITEYEIYTKEGKFIIKYATIRTWNVNTAEDLKTLVNGLIYLRNKDKNYPLTVTENYDFDTTTKSYLKKILYRITNNLPIMS